MKNLFILLLLVLGFGNLSATSVDLSQADVEESSACVWDQLDNVGLNGVSEEVEIIFFVDDKVIGDIQLSFIFDQSDEVYKNSKKKKEKAAAIFYGLANAATSLAQAVGGKPKEGVTNFIGAIFGAAAQIAQIEANYEKNFDHTLFKNPIFFDLMVNMTESLYEIISVDHSRNTSLSRFPTLKELSARAVYAQRVSWVADKVLDNTFVQGILKESLDYLEIYLHEQVDEAMQFLKEKLLVGYKDEAIALNVSSDILSD